MDELDLPTANEVGWRSVATSLLRNSLTSTFYPLASQRRSEKKHFHTRLELENRQKVGFRRPFRSPVPSDRERLCRLGVSSFFRPLESSDKLRRSDKGIDLTLIFPRWKIGWRVFRPLARNCQRWCWMDWIK